MKLLLPILTLLIISCGSKKKEGVRLFILDHTATSIPDSVFQKKELTLLHISCEGYTLYPPLSALPSDYSRMPLYEIPERIGGLTGLDTLMISCTKITKLPAAIVHLENLELLDLSMNSYLDVSRELDKLKQLRSLKTLNIFATKTTEEQARAIRKALKKVKVVYTMKEFMEFEKFDSMEEIHLAPGDSLYKLDSSDKRTIDELIEQGVVKPIK